MSVLDEALKLSTRLAVFPCLASKKPACPNGFKNATRIPEEIVSLWKRYPGELIGYPTGEINNVDVLDIDPKNLGDQWLDEARDSLPITRIHHTRSGGVHYLFRHAEGVKNSAGKVAPGVDVRGEGGFAIAWNAHGFPVENPTILDNWPIWLFKLLKPAIPRRPVALPATRAEADSRAQIMIERAYERVRNAPPGQRHYQLRAAGATLGGLARFLDKSLDHIERDLVDLIMQTGAEDKRNAEATARWAVNRGAAAPLLTGS